MSKDKSSGSDNSKSASNLEDSVVMAGESSSMEEIDLADLPIKKPLKKSEQESSMEEVNFSEFSSKIKRSEIQSVIINPTPSSSLSPNSARKEAFASSRSASKDELIPSPRIDNFGAMEDFEISELSSKSEEEKELRTGSVIISEPTSPAPSPLPSPNIGRQFRNSEDELAIGSLSSRSPTPSPLPSPNVGRQFRNNRSIATPSPTSEQTSPRTASRRQMLGRSMAVNNTGNISPNVEVDFHLRRSITPIKEIKETQGKESDLRKRGINKDPSSENTHAEKQAREVEQQSTPKPSFAERFRKAVGKSSSKNPRPESPANPNPGPESKHSKTSDSETSAVDRLRKSRSSSESLEK